MQCSSVPDCYCRSGYQNFIKNVSWCNCWRLDFASKSENKKALAGRMLMLCLMTLSLVTFSTSWKKKSGKLKCINYSFILGDKINFFKVHRENDE